MKNCSLLACLLVAASCGGGGSTPAKEPAPPPDPDPRGEPVEPVEDEEEPEEPPRPPPMQWYAKVSLSPVKGSRMKPAVVRFAQTEGERVHATTDEPLRGLKAGRYHLVVHEGGACGKNARSAGPAWSEAGATISLEVVKGEPATIDQADLDLMLDGGWTIVGRALVVHADKKGEPAKPLACGVIESVEASTEVEPEEPSDEE